MPRGRIPSRLRTCPNMYKSRGSQCRTGHELGFPSRNVQRIRVALITPRCTCVFLNLNYVVTLYDCFRNRAGTFDATGPTQRSYAGLGYVWGKWEVLRGRKLSWVTWAAEANADVGRTQILPIERRSYTLRCFRSIFDAKQSQFTFSHAISTTFKNPTLSTRHCISLHKCLFFF